MNKAHSSDGTAIAFDRLGDGPPVILVCGASTDRTANAPLAALLAERFTVFNYDRRGRGDSGDTTPYAVEREVEDMGVPPARAVPLPSCSCGSPPRAPEATPRDFPTFPTSPLTTSAIPLILHLSYLISYFE
jgi:hypothetical protein